ncbi:MAG: hypothetical protein H0W97_02030 [Actinobacteria bacterium]|nr:hypothetical protein [Actinomycetota bacterium]
MAAKIEVRVTDNASLNVDGRIYRAGDVLTVERDDTVAQWISAGWASEVKKAGKPRRKASGSVSRRE